MSRQDKIVSFSTARLTAENPILAHGKLVIDSDTGYLYLGDGDTPWTTLPAIAIRLAGTHDDPRLPAVITASFPFTDVRWFGAAPDFDLATQTVVTDSTAAFQAAIDATEPGGVVYVPRCPAGKGFVHGPLTINNPISVRGVNRYSSRIVALPSSTGYLYNVEIGVLGVDLREETHGFGFEMSDVYLDGAHRVPDIGAVKFSQFDRITMERMQIRNFARQALYFAKSVRESEFRSVYIRWCGGPDYPTLDLTDTHVGDQHNNIAFSGCKVLYSFGEAIHMESNQASVRNIELESCMIHNVVPSQIDVETEHVEDADGWANLVTGRELETPLIHLVDARGISFRGCRLHSAGFGQPLILIRDGSVASPKSTRLTNCSLGEVSSKTLANVSVASNVFTSTGHQLGTGALVRVTDSSLVGTTDYWVIRLSVDTFSLAATHAQALAGTPVVTVTDDVDVTVTTQQRQIDIDGTNAYLGVNECDATNGTVYRAVIIDRPGIAGRVTLTNGFSNVTAGIE